MPFLSDVVCGLQPPAHAGSLLADFCTLNEAIFSSETSVHTRSTRRHIREDGIVHRGDMFFRNLEDRSFIATALRKQNEEYENSFEELVLFYTLCFRS
jgi:hypothetical protein